MTSEVDIDVDFPWYPQYPYNPTHKKKKLFMEYRSLGHTLQEALDLADIAERTYYLWKTRDRDFNYWSEPEHLEQLRREKRDDIVCAGYFKLAHLLQEDALNWFLEIKKKPYNERTAADIRVYEKFLNTYASPTQLKAIRDFGEHGENGQRDIIEVFKKLEDSRMKVIDGEYTEVGDDVSNVSTTNASYNQETKENYKDLVVSSMRENG